MARRVLGFVLVQIESSQFISLTLWLDQKQASWSHHQLNCADADVPFLGEYRQVTQPWQAMSVKPAAFQ